MSGIAAVVETIFGLLTLIVIYDVFLGDFISEKLSLKRKMKSSASNADKLSRVKMISDDPKDIEKFINDNAQYLSASSIEQLVCRIELLKAEKVIDSDNNLKTRIDALDPIESPQVEEARQLEANLPKAKKRK